MIKIPYKKISYNRDRNSAKKALLRGHQGTVQGYQEGKASWGTRAQYWGVGRVKYRKAPERRIEVSGG